MIATVDFVLWAAVQMPFLVLMSIARGIWRVSSTGYYIVTKTRRRIKGEPEWQEHDRLLGQPSPEETKRLEERRERARVYQNELAEHARGCDECWPSFIRYHYFEDEGASGCDIGKMLRKRSNETLGIAA